MVGRQTLMMATHGSTMMSIAAGTMASVGVWMVSMGDLVFEG